MTLNITADGNTLIPINRGHLFSIAVSGTLDGTIKAQYATSGPVAASLSTALTGDDNDLVFTAKTPGAGGNSLTVAYVDLEEPDAPLSFAFDGTDLVVTLATDSGDAASVTLEPTGDNNDIAITADADGPGGNAYSVELLDPSANDAALSVSTTDNLKFSVSLATGEAGAITSTAAQVVAALNAYAPFAALMTAANAAGNNGSGVVTAIAEADLTGGGGNAAITTTAADIAAMVTASDQLQRHLTVANKAENDGTGEVTALSETALANGTNGAFVDYESGDSGDLAAAGELVLRNIGAINAININASGITTTDADVVILDLGRNAN